MSQPLLLTTGRWHNKQRVLKDEHDLREMWIKKLAHTGKLTQFAYGSDTLAEFMPSAGMIADFPACILQKCIICTYGTRVFVVDVDYPELFAATRTSRLIGRDQAMSTRGAGYHVLVDGRGVPPGHWPRQRAIAGADIKANGWVPVPGSIHYSGALYEPVLDADGYLPRVRATPELLAAIRADQADRKGKSGSKGGPGGTGGGHDGEVAAHALGWLRQAANSGLDPKDPAVRKEVYAKWLKVAVALDPGWPYGHDDFERHCRTALQTIAADPGEVLTPGAMAWALAHVPPGSE